MPQYNDFMEVDDIKHHDIAVVYLNNLVNLINSTVMDTFRNQLPALSAIIMVYHESAHNDIHMVARKFAEECSSTVRWVTAIEVENHADAVTTLQLYRSCCMVNYRTSVNGCSMDLKEPCTVTAVAAGVQLRGGPVQHLAPRNRVIRMRTWTYGYNFTALGDVSPEFYGDDADLAINTAEYRTVTLPVALPRPLEASQENYAPYTQGIMEIGLMDSSRGRNPAAAVAPVRRFVNARA